MLLRFVAPLYLLVYCTLNSPLWSDEDRPQSPRASRTLTLERIYAGNEFEVGTTSVEWHDDQSWWQWDPAAGKGLLRVHAQTGDTTVVVPRDDLIPPGTSEPLAVEKFSWSKPGDKLLLFTNSQRVWRERTRGDYWLYDRTSRVLLRLGGDSAPGTLMFATLSPDGQRVAYVRDGALYIQDLLDGSIAPVQPPRPQIISGTFDWVYEEELSLRHGFRWSPDGRRIAFWELNTEGVPMFTLVNNTDGFYPELIRFPYPKTGQRNSACRIGIYTLANHRTQWLPVPGDSREHYICRLEWDGPNAVVLQQLNRLQNRNHVLHYEVSEQGGISSQEATLLQQEIDAAWVDVHDEMFWLSDRSRFTWISERSGWREIYWVKRQGGEPERVTPGGFDVIRLLGMDEDRQRLYFLASPEQATQQYLYQIAFDGTQLARLTPEDQPGTHDYELSPHGQFAIHHYSRFGQVPRTDVIALDNHRRLRMLEKNQEVRQRFKRLRRGPQEFFRIPIQADVELDAWCILPPDFDDQQRYPLLIYVYGEPAGQTVTDRWQGNTYLWHLMLAQQGYVVVSIDNRGTPAPRGREWRKAVHRQVGILAPEDQAKAVRKLLADRPYLDPQRVGVWGWSGGGSMTLHAIFKFPELYRVGISVAPVPNQRHYDTIYQERYMGLPTDNVEGYLQGSPIHFAKQLRGQLLLIHGTGDDNCHYQGTEALINELVRADKSFRLMAYPNRTHAIREGAGTTLHLRRLMTDYLQDHLPAGPNDPPDASRAKKR